MFGISLGEVVLIGLVSLIFLGPQDLARIVKVLLKFIALVKTKLNDFKADLYHKSGFSELNNLHHQAITQYNDLKTQIWHNYTITSEETSASEIVFYQPELDFEREPELFDDIPMF